MDIRFDTWNIGLYRAGSLVTVSKYKLDLVGVQEGRREVSGTKLAGEYTFLYYTIFS
jgi:hypothetical protein